MLARAKEALPDADLRVSRLEDPLPEGPFNLVVSALAVHHLAADRKRDLFRRIAFALSPGGCFVLGDVVVPERPEDAQIEIDWVVDLPDRAADQLSWLHESGFEAEVVWSQRDLAVIRAHLKRRGRSNAPPSAFKVGADDGQVAVRPGDLGLEARLVEPGELVGRAVR